MSTATVCRGNAALLIGVISQQATSQSSSPAIRETICSFVNRLSLIIRASWRRSGGTICIASLLLSNSTIIQPQCTPASQPQSACVTKCEPNCSIARSALSQVSCSSSWCSSIMYRGMRGSLFLKCRRQNTRRSIIPNFTRSPRHPCSRFSQACQPKISRHLISHPKPLTFC